MVELPSLVGTETENPIGAVFFQQNPEVGYGLTKDESAQVQPKKTTLPETNSLHLTMDAWNTRFVLGWPISGCYVSLPEGRRKVSKAGMIFFR